MISFYLCVQPLFCDEHLLGSLQQVLYKSTRVDNVYSVNGQKIPQSKGKSDYTIGY